MFQNCFLNDVSVSCLSLFGEVNSWNECENDCKSNYMKPFKLVSLFKLNRKTINYAFEKAVTVNPYRRIPETISKNRAVTQGISRKLFPDFAIFRQQNNFFEESFRKMPRKFAYITLSDNGFQRRLFKLCIGYKR